MAGSDNRDRRDTGTDETWEAVLADAHALCKGFKDAGFDGDAHDIRVLVEQLEAAHKRELESVTKRNGLGNAAKMREALKTLRDFVESGSLAEGIINAALAAPARNCDCFVTSVDAIAYFNKHNQPLRADPRPNLIDGKKYERFSDWLMDTANGAEKGGE